MKINQILSVVLLTVQLIFNVSSRAVKTSSLCTEKVRRNSFLWKLKREPPVYFFGTIHVPYNRVWNHIPPSSKKAFRQSENVFFELDLTSAQTLSALTQCQMLPRGTDLREVLPSDLFQRLKRHFDYVKRSMPNWLSSEHDSLYFDADYLFNTIVGNWEKKRPIWVMLMINSLTEADVRSRSIPVLDLHLARQAEKMGKKVGAVEKVEEQCQPLNGLNMSQVFYALNYTLMMQEKVRYGTVKIPYSTDDLINQYNCGEINSEAFDKETSQVPKLNNRTFWEDKTSFLEEDKDATMATDIDLYFKKELIYRRNQRMAHRVKSLLDAYPDQSFFFAFGTGHFLGNGSVIDFLQKEGYEIDNIPPEDPKRFSTEMQSRDNAASTDLTEKNTWPSRGRKPRRRKKNKMKRKSNRASKRERKLRRQQKRKVARSNQLKSRKPTRNLWTRLSDSKNSLKKFPNFHPEEYTAEEDYSQVRVVSRFPTMFPYYEEEDKDRVTKWELSLPGGGRSYGSSSGHSNKDNNNYRISGKFPALPSKSKALKMDWWSERFLEAQYLEDATGNGISTLYSRMFDRYVLLSCFFVACAATILNW